MYSGEIKLFNGMILTAIDWVFNDKGICLVHTQDNLQNSDFQSLSTLYDTLKSAETNINAMFTKFSDTGKTLHTTVLSLA